MAEIKQLSIRHDAIMDHLMAYPQQAMGEVARIFGVSGPWLSCIVHSDAFQEALRMKQGIAFHHTVLPIREKMTAVAHAALDRLADRIPFEDEPKNLSGIAADVLDRLGFGTNKGNVVQFNQQNNIHVSALREEITAAQALLGRGPPPREVAHNGERTVLALPHSGADEEIPAAEEAGMGEADLGAALSFAIFQQPESEVGGALREEGALAAGGAL